MAGTGCRRRVRPDESRYLSATFHPGLFAQMSDRILIVDFGSQVTQLIARRVRESGVYCEIQPFGKVDAESIRAFDPAGIILSGGPASVTADASPRAPEAVFEAGQIGRAHV